jgi:DegV family protein with EDD domain
MNLALRIITDSTCDIPVEAQEKLGIDIVPLSVHFGDKEYLDGVDLKNEQFYSMLENAKELPTTSQVNPSTFEEIFEKYIANGDTVLGIFISGKISGTYQSAVIAKDMVKSDKIYLIDSKTATFGLMIFVNEAVKMRDNGESIEKIVSVLENMSRNIKFYAIIKDLKYLKMGGRISSSTAIVGTLLGINPIVGIIDGEVKPLGKARGQKAAYKWVLSKIKEGNPDYSYAFGFAHSNAPSLMRDFIDFLSKELPIKHINTGDIGCVIGTHAGPGCVGAAYIEKE